jgi:hypothetical protein
VKQKQKEMNIVILNKIIFIIVDAFVALGGLPSKEGKISKLTLIQIIKTEFELTIDMEVNPYII